MARKRAEKKNASSGAPVNDYIYELTPVYRSGGDYVIEPESTGYTQPPKRKKFPWGIVITLLVLLAAGLGAFGYYTAKTSRLASEIASVAALDTIYPNVSVNGVELGGLTAGEAVEALADAGLDPYRGKSITVNLPQGKTMTVTAEELGLGADLTVPVENAWTYGRTGTPQENYDTYQLCETSPTKLVWDGEYTLDETTLRSLVNAAAAEVNVQELDSTAEIGEDGITLTKGVEAATVDSEAAFQQLKDAFLHQNFSDITIDFQPTEPTGSEEVDDAALLQSVYDTIYTEPVNAMYDKEKGGVVESVKGVSFDMDEAMELWTDAEPGEEVFIPFVYTEPEITKLDDMLFRDLLAEKSTSLGGSSDARIHNITLAAQAMDETVVNPGETFDYNSCLGERTEARGYQEAGAYSAGKHVTEVGGGICQGSSTLYYCALHANLKITVRSNHYFVVDYLPRGLDATVSWGGPDFRFVDDRDYPIKIKAWVADGELHVQIWGTNVDGSYVVVTNETWEDEDFYYAQTYRIVYDKDGNQIASSKEAYSNYHKHEAEEETEPTPEPEQQSYYEPEPQSYYEPEQQTYTEPEPVYEPVTEPDPTAPPEAETTYTEQETYIDPGQQEQEQVQGGDGEEEGIVDPGEVVFWD